MFKDQVYPVPVLLSFLFQGGPQAHSPHNKLAATVLGIICKHDKILRNIPWPSLVSLR